MQSHSYFSAECSCGKVNNLQAQGQSFTCQCGRKSVIDFSIGYSERELVEILNGLDAQRDSLVKAIEWRRQKVAA